jgi:peptide/nickel transport system permease protein
VTGTLDFAREAGEGDLAPTAPETEAQKVAARSPMELFWRRLKSDRVAMTALIFIVFLIACAILAPLIIKITGQRPPNEQSTKYLDSFGTPSGPTSENWFGVDPLGRSVFSRVLYGARVSLEVALLATAVSVTIGVTIGLLSGYYRGWVDTLLSRVIDVLLAFPILLLAIGLASACSLGNGCLGGFLQPGKWLVMLVIAFVNWTYIARIIRGQVLSMREKDFVDASLSIGASNRRILFRELLPNLVAPIIVYSTLIIPQNVLFEAALSFLGVGVQPPDASWGQMIADATEIFDTAWWYMFFPGTALLLTVLAFNLLGDGLQDALNPRASRSN